MLTRNKKQLARRMKKQVESLAKDRKERQVSASCPATQTRRACVQWRLSGRAPAAHPFARCLVALCPVFLCRVVLNSAAAVSMGAPSVPHTHTHTRGCTLPSSKTFVKCCFLPVFVCLCVQAKFEAEKSRLQAEIDALTAQVRELADVKEEAAGKLARVKSSREELRAQLAEVQDELDGTAEMRRVRAAMDESKRQVGACPVDGCVGGRACARVCVPL